MSTRPFDYLNPHMDYINEPGALIRDNGQKPMDGYSGFNGKFGKRKSKRRKSKKRSSKKRSSKKSKRRLRKFSKKRKRSRKRKSRKRKFSTRKKKTNKKSMLGYSQEDFICPYCDFKMKTLASPDILVKWNVLHQRGGYACGNCHKLLSISAWKGGN